MFNIVRKSMELAGRTLTLETGRMAKQANGSVLVTFGETVMLVTATASKEPREGTDFFPLIVDFNEKMYASGKIPGGFIKREARPSTMATLCARLIDRSIRPLFPDGFRNEVQIVVTILSFDESCDPGPLGILGASTALSISDIPFHGPIAGAAVGEIDGEFKLYPTDAEIQEATIDLSVAGSETSIVMIESGALESVEDRMVEAVYFGHEAIKQMIGLQKELIDECAKEKMEIKVDLVPEEITKKIDDLYGERIKEASHILGKLERQDAFDALKDEMLEKFKEELEAEEYDEQERYFKNGFHDLIKKYVRSAILKDHHRADGRGLDDIREITCEVDIIPRVHGSALFTRGETQALGALTLGSVGDEKVIDGLNEEYRKHFYLHYNFPPFSVGEVGFMRGPGRRELGHGMLAERGLKPMVPPKEDFPYTIRLVSEILESNGSSSMATVCAGTLAMMAAGVPMKKPVAGIANGLIMDDGEYVVLTDIMGLEDHLGDMDFKVTGTRDGITAMQMDIKIEGITKDIMTIALTKAKAARLFILDKIEAVIPEPRKDLSKYAPRIESFTIDTAKIGEVIGPSGKMIKAIIEKTGVEINIEDDGTVSIMSQDGDSMAEARRIIENIVFGPQYDEIYEGVITRIEGYGVFVKIMDGLKEGMVHISNMDTCRINQPTDLVKLGDTVKTKFIGAEKGKIALSMKGIPGNPSKADDPDYKVERSHGGGNGGGGRRDDRRDDRRGGGRRDDRRGGRDDHRGESRDRGRRRYE